MEGEAASFTAFVVEVLRSYGLAGLVMLAMGFVIRALWNDNVYLRNTLFDTGNKAIEANSAMAQAMQALRTDVLTTSGRRGARGGE